MSQPTKSKALSSSPAGYRSNSNPTPIQSSPPYISWCLIVGTFTARALSKSSRSAALPLVGSEISAKSEERALPHAPMFFWSHSKTTSAQTHLCWMLYMILKPPDLAYWPYADGAHNWPIRARCLPLVAGASNVLDSSRSDFGSELFQLLVQFSQAEARREEDERCIKQNMIQAGIVGESQSMLAVFRTVLRVSVLSDLPILLTGETGTGKELLAHAIHALDPKRRSGPFHRSELRRHQRGLS